jgi:hypothetical protein
VQLQAVRAGRLFNEFIGIPIVVKDTTNARGGNGYSAAEDEEHVIVNEVKKLGLLIDRYVDLEMRLGDTLVIYISRGSS